MNRLFLSVIIESTVKDNVLWDVTVNMVKYSKSNFPERSYIANNALFKILFA